MNSFIYIQYQYFCLLDFLYIVIYPYMLYQMHVDAIKIKYCVY